MLNKPSNATTTYWMTCLNNLILMAEQVLQAEAFRGLGKAQYGSDPAAAIQWMERALEAIRVFGSRR